MLFDYNQQKAFLSTLQVDDLGHLAIRAKNGMGTLEHYMIIETIAGKSAILTWGPVGVDLPCMVDKFSMSYHVENYKESILSKEITRFINDPKREITEAEVITVDEAMQALPTAEVYHNSLS